MNSIQIKRTIFSLIKVISIVLISGAIALEAWNLYAVLTNQQIPGSLILVFWIERFIVASHAIEAIIAAYYAPFRNKAPLSYGVYTFFVGTVGLIELFLQEPTLPPIK